MAAIADVVKDPALWGCIRLSAQVACVSLPLMAIAGVGLGYVLGRRRGRLVTLLDFFVTLPLVFPPVATGFLLLLLLGRHSAIGAFLKFTLGVDMIFSFQGVVLAAFLAGLPLIVKQVQAAIRADIDRLIESASVLGKSPSTTFFRVTLPCLRKSITIGLFLAFTRSLGEVGMTLMLGGNIAGRTNTISLEVFTAVFTGDYDRALVLVSLLGAVSLLLIALTRTLAEK